MGDQANLTLSMADRGTRTIFITCMGTRGDIEPYTALGAGLKTKGWGVIIGSPPEFQGMIEEQGLQFHDIGKSLTAPPQSDLGKSLTNGGLMKQMGAIESYFDIQTCCTWFKLILEGVQKHAPDVLLLTVGTTMIGASFIPKLLNFNNTVVCSGFLIPCWHQTRHFLPPVGGLGHKFRWKFLNKIVWTLTSSLSMKFIEKIAMTTIMQSLSELKIVPPAGYSVKAQDIRKSLFEMKTFYMYPSSLLPKPADWPDHVEIVGAHRLHLPGLEPFVQKSRNPLLPCELDDFIRAGNFQNQPIIYIGFGSAVTYAFDDNKVPAVFSLFSEVLRELCQNTPVRAVIHVQHDMKYLDSLSQNPNLIVWSKPVPHRYLFPQCSIIIHHGGIGTTIAALEAGKPSLVIPCSRNNDQTFWSDLICMRQLGPRGFLADTMTKEKLTSAIRDGLANLAIYTQNAITISAAMQHENSLDKTISFLKGCFP